MVYCDKTFSYRRHLQLSWIKLKQLPELLSAMRYILEKLIIFLLPVPLLFLIIGTKGIIEKDSPENLGSINSLSQSFFNYFEMHTLIISGALGITFIVWLFTRNMWHK